MLSPYFHDLPHLTTPRLLLRPLCVSDAEDVFTYARDPQVSRFVLWSTHQKLQESREFLAWALECGRRGELTPWGIQRLDTGRLIGTIGFVDWSVAHARAELGYALGRDHWGMGFGQEALRGVLIQGFEVLELNRIEAKVFPGNTASVKLLERCGFLLEGTLRQHTLCKGAFTDILLYARLRKDWAKDAFPAVGGSPGNTGSVGLSAL